jgi:hypothetical protein
MDEDDEEEEEIYARSSKQGTTTAGGFDASQSGISDLIDDSQSSASGSAPREISRERYTPHPILTHTECCSLSNVSAPLVKST